MMVPSDPRERRQWYLDESLRIAVWEVVFGTGPHSRVEELLGAGAIWQPEVRADERYRTRAERAA